MIWKSMNVINSWDSKEIQILQHFIHIGENQAEIHMFLRLFVYFFKKEKKVIYFEI